MSEPVEGESRPYRTTVGEAAQPNEPLFGDDGGDDGGERQHEEEMPHAVEQHGLDRDRIHDRKDDADTEERGGERILAPNAKIGENEHHDGYNRRGEQQNEDQLRQSNRDMGGQV